MDFLVEHNTEDIYSDILSLLPFFVVKLVKHGAKERIERTSNAVVLILLISQIGLN